MATILEKSNQILTEKQTKIIPENIKSGTQVFNVVGTLEGLNGEEIEISPSTEEQVIVPSEGKNAITNATVKAVDATIDSNIVAENIKKDVSILGVVGTLEEGGGSSTYNAKLFKTATELEADEHAKLDDMAIVYGDSVGEISVDSQFQVLTFSDEVVLDEAFTSEINCNFRDIVLYATEAYISMSSTQFRFSWYSDGGETSGSVMYTSSDGITYTRTDSLGNPIDLGAKVQCYDSGAWNDVFSNFLHEPINTFDGLFKYSSYEDRTEMITHKDVSYSYDTDGNLQVSSGEILAFPIGTYLTKFEEIFDALGITSYYDVAAIYDGDKTLNLYYTKYNATSSYSSAMFFVGEGDSPTYVGAYSSYTNPKKVELNLETGEYTEIDLTSLGEILNSEFKIYEEIPANSYLFRFCASNTNLNWSYDIVFTGYNSDKTSYENFSLGSLPSTKYAYLVASNQFTAKATHVFEKVFMGKDGVESGTIGETVDTHLKDTNYEIWSKLQAKYDTPVILTGEQPKSYFSSIKGELIPQKVQTTGATNFQCMYGWCYNVKEIDLTGVDTSSATTLSQMFTDCENLVSMDTSNMTGPNCTNVSHLFNACRKIKRIDLSNFTNSVITSVFRTFWGCNALEYLDISGWSFSNCNVSASDYMFDGCKVLQTVYVKDSAAKTFIDAKLSASGLSITSTIKS